MRRACRMAGKREKKVRGAPCAEHPAPSTLHSAPPAVHQALTSAHRALHGVRLAALRAPSIPRRSAHRSPRTLRRPPCTPPTERCPRCSQRPHRPPLPSAARRCHLPAGATVGGTHTVPEPVPLTAHAAPTPPGTPPPSTHRGRRHRPRAARDAATSRARGAGIPGAAPLRMRPAAGGRHRARAGGAGARSGGGEGVTRVPAPRRGGGYVCLRVPGTRLRSTGKPVPGHGRGRAAVPPPGAGVLRGGAARASSSHPRAPATPGVPLDRQHCDHCGRLIN